MFLNEISDDYLIVLYYEKNQDAIDLLFERYKMFIYGIISGLQKRDGDYIDFEELFQEGVLTFMNCLDRYDVQNGCFYFFAKTSIERKLMDKIKIVKKYGKVVSLDEQFYEVGHEKYVDYIAEESDYSYYDNSVYNNLVSRIDDKNKMIVDLKMEGYSYNEIAIIIGSNKQDIYRRVAKIKNILKDVMEKID